MLKITIPIPPRTKKNSSRIVTGRNGKPFLIPSKAYKEFEQAAGYFLKPQHIDYPVNVKCLYYMPTKRRVDLVNLLEATCDILVKYEVLEDDNFKIVASHDGSKVLHDKENPRTEIEISRI